MMMDKLKLILFFALTLGASILLAAETPRIGTNAIMPQVDGDWWTITDGQVLPDLGEFVWTNGTLPIDFSIWQAEDGTWQLDACVRGLKKKGEKNNFRVFYRWEGTSLTEDNNWKPQGISLSGLPEYGESSSVHQAPHVLKYDDGKYRMFYGVGNTISLAESDDGKTFDRVLNASGESTLFPAFMGPQTEWGGKSSYNNSRDPVALKDGDTYYCYYAVSGVSKGKWGEEPYVAGGFACQTSTDLKAWTDPVIVSTGGVAGSTQICAECPHVIKRHGMYYLFRSGTDSKTYVYCSDNPLDFGVNDDRYYTGLRWEMDGVEIFHHEGQDYIACFGQANGKRSYRIAKLKWVE